MIVSLILRLCLIVICLNEAYGCDRYSFTGGVYNDERDDSDVETNRTVHIVNWSGRLIRKVQNYTQLTVQWDHPVGGLQLCAYNLHYYRGRDTANVGKHYTVNVRPNVSEYVIKELDMGTSYHAYVEAVFNRPVANGNRQILRSWILITKTLGIGVDNPCSCTQQATVGNCVDCCDKQTGTCICKDTNTYGQQCERCADQFYMDPELGCVACDQCASDGVAGDGSCKPDLNNGGMQCSCKLGYGGKHCKACDVGFYRQNGVCIPCDCSDNQKITIKDFCNEKGNCLACDYHTAGDHCEICYPGYVGNALARTCHMPPRIGEHFGIALATIAAIVIGFLMFAVLLRQLCRRRNQHTLLTGGKNGSSSAVNFTTLMEEPYNDVYSDRKLHRMSNSANA